MASEDNSLLVAQVSTDAETGETHVDIVESAGTDESHAEAEAGDANAVDTHADEAHAGDGTHASTEAHGDDHGSGVFPPFDPATFGSQLIWLALTFGALYVIMSRVALPRIGEILETRRDRVEGDLAEADRLRQKTDQAITAYETDLANARKKAHGIAETTREKVKSELETQRQSMEGELAERVNAAETRIQDMKSEVLKNVDEIAAETAQALVSQVSGKVSIKAARDAVAQVIKG